MVRTIREGINPFCLLPSALCLSWINADFNTNDVNSTDLTHPACLSFKATVLYTQVFLSMCSFVASACTFVASACTFVALPCTFVALPCTFVASACTFVASACTFVASACTFVASPYTFVASAYAFVASKSKN
ncbi:hypothetical protein NIES25_41390 [Nostoc linckia NIES-25]|nr:hypothetical protein NIES25_41390 [Nostoc linckia NIES-25]